MKKKKKFTNTRLFKILRVIFIIVVLVIVIKLAGKLFYKSNENLVLIIGNKKVDLKNELIVDKDDVYISQNDIADIYDANIYYDKDEKMIITTHNKSVAKLEVGKTTMEVNSTEVALNGKVKEVDGMIYLPLLDLERIYDFEYKYNKEENVLILDSVSQEKQEAVVIKNAKVKEGTKFFSKTLEKIKKSSGEYVTVLETEGDYTKVRTNSGNIGYIETNKLSKPKKVREDMEESKLDNLKILEEYNDVSSSNEEVTLDSNYTNIVAPNLFEINENLELENVIDLTSKKYESYKSWAEENNVIVGATVTLKGSINAICSSYTLRTCLVNNLYNEFVNNRLEMICIDFDSIDDVEGFYRFIIELTPRFKEIGYKVVVKYKSDLNRERLENIVDCVVD